MRQAFTLIELMIVIAIIAIIAAIAIPNLLESRVTSQENASAAALKSGLLPAQVQFQAGGYLDVIANGAAGTNGLGEYAAGPSGGAASTSAYDWLCGATPVTGNITLSLVAPTFRGIRPTISGHTFLNPVSIAGSEEQVWAVGAYPVDNNQGRRQFCINQAGNIYGLAPSQTASVGMTLSGTSVFGANLSGMPSTAVGWQPYRR